jgi:hypothetical protein
MASIGSLTASLALESAAFMRDLSKASKAIATNSASMRRSLQSVDSSIKNSARAIGAFAAAVGVIRVVNFTKQVLESASAISEQAKALGFTAEEFQVYQFAADQAGGSVEGLGKMFGILTKNVAAARAGTGPLFSALKDTNPVLLEQVKNANSVADAFDMILKAMANAPDVFSQARIGAAAFGKGFKEALSLVQGGFLEAKQQATDFNIVISSNVAERVDAIVDGMKLLQQAAFAAFNTGFVKGFGEEVVNTKALVEAIQKAITRVGEIVGTVARKVLDNADEIADKAVEIVEAFGPKVLEFTKYLFEGVKLVATNLDLIVIAVSALAVLRLAKIFDDAAAAALRFAGVLVLVVAELKKMHSALTLMGPLWLLLNIAADFDARTKEIVARSEELEKLAANTSAAAEANKEFNDNDIPKQLANIATAGGPATEALFEYAGALQKVAEAKAAAAATPVSDIFKMALPPLPKPNTEFPTPSPGIKTIMNPGAAEADAAAKAQATYNAQLTLHKELLQQIGSPAEQYKLKLEEIAATNYSAADAARANNAAAMEFSESQTALLESVGLSLSPQQEYDAMLQKIASSNLSAADASDAHAAAAHRLREAQAEVLASIGLLPSPLQQYQTELSKVSMLEQQGAITAVQAFNARVVASAGFANQFLGMAGAVTGALASMFKENKAIAVADAVVNTAAAIVAALKNPPGPPFSFVYAAAAAAAGAAQIATILSTQPGSSKVPSVKSGGKTVGATASAGAASRSSSSGAAGPTQTITLNITGDVFGPDHFRKIIDGINGAQRDGTLLVNLQGA